jgi:AmmeMemoRadiSam system protein B
MRSSVVLGAAVAGSWYPRDRDELAGLVDGLLDAASGRAATPPQKVAAVIAPHAGFVYSGPVAASAFVNLRGSRFDRVILLGPSHYFGFHGAAVPDEAVAYRTPLGDVPIDLDAVAALRGASPFRADDHVFEPEHSIEAELPFLQRVLASDVPIVPVLLGGRTSHAEAGRVASALERFRDASTLFVVSSDFTHFGPRFGYVPFDDDVPARVKELDMRAVAAIEAGDPEAFSRHVDTTGATICGHRAIDVLLSLLGGPGAATLLEYDTSGRMTGSWDHSVSYAAIVVPSVRTVAA